MHTDPRPDEQPNRPVCWCCGQDLHQNNVAVFLDPARRHFVHCCAGCWEQLPAEKRLELALKFDERRRAVAQQKAEESGRELQQSLYREWLKVAERINRMPEEAGDDWLYGRHRN